MYYHITLDIYLNNGRRMWKARRRDSRLQDPQAPLNFLLEGLASLRNES